MCNFYHLKDLKRAQLHLNMIREARRTAHSSLPDKLVLTATACVFGKIDFGSPATSMDLDDVMQHVEFGGNCFLRLLD